MIFIRKIASDLMVWIFRCTLFQPLAEKKCTAEKAIIDRVEAITWIFNIQPRSAGLNIKMPGVGYYA